MNDHSDTRTAIDYGTSSNGTATLTDRVRELRLDGKVDSNRNRGSGGSNWLPWSLCILLAIAWGGIGIRWYRTGSPSVPGTNPSIATLEKGTNSPGTTPSTSTTSSSSAGTPNTPSDAIVLVAKGNIIPAHQIAVSPVDVVGRITELNIEEGKRFKTGDILAVIDDTRFRADYELAKASAAASHARYLEQEASYGLQLDQAESEATMAKRTMERVKLLYDTNRRNYETRTKSISELEIMQSEKDYMVSLSQVTVAEKKRDLAKGEARKQSIAATKQEWHSAEARVRLSKWYLDNCTIRSPVTGIVLTKKAEKGSLINPVVGGVSTSLCEIADLSDLEVDLEIQERDIKKFFVGQTCKIFADAYPERIYEAYVDRAMPIANRARGILPVRIKIIVPETEEQGKYLKPEMGVTVNFLNRESASKQWQKKRDEMYPHKKLINMLMIPLNQGFTAAK